MIIVYIKHSEYDICDPTFFPDPGSTPGASTISKSSKEQQRQKAPEKSGAFFLIDSMSGHYGRKTRSSLNLTHQTPFITPPPFASFGLTHNHLLPILPS
jgi:hypothetical protein